MNGVRIVVKKYPGHDSSAINTHIQNAQESTKLKFRRCLWHRLSYQHIGLCRLQSHANERDSK